MKLTETAPKPTPYTNEQMTLHHDNGSAETTKPLVITLSIMISFAFFFFLLHKIYGRIATNPMQSQLFHVFKIATYIATWYSISIGMTMFNKWFLKHWNGGFPFSVTMSCIHMVIKLLLSRTTACCSNSKFNRLPNKFYWALAVPIGLCTALDIMCSNLSFKYVTVSFYTIIKSGTNVWNLLFSFLLKMQKVSCPLVLVVLLISSGIGLASYGSVTFVWGGFFLVLLSSILGTLRWVLTQYMLGKMQVTDNRTLQVIYEISPASAVGLIPAVFILELGKIWDSEYLANRDLLFRACCFIVSGGVMAFGLIFVEIALVKKTSALSLGIAGNLKDITQIGLAVVIFGDPISRLNLFGMFCAFSGMVLYTYLKTRSRDTSYVPVEFDDMAELSNSAAPEEDKSANGAAATEIELRPLAKDV